MLKKMFFLSFILLLTNLTLAQSEDWKSLDKSNFSIKYPGDWDLDESGMMGSKFILFSKQTSGTDTFKENVNLIIQDISGYNLTMDQYVELTIQQVKTMINNSKLLLSERVKDGDSEYHKFKYNGDQGQYNLTFLQHVWIIKEKAYILTFTTEQDQFEDFKDTGESIFETFKIK